MTSRKGKKKHAPRVAPPAEKPPLPPIPLIESPRAILDEALSAAARTVAMAAEGHDVSREQLTAAQDILNRGGFGASGGKTTEIPEAFAREAFGFVFHLLGFPPIKWPRVLETVPVEDEEQTVDAFNDALQET